MRWSEHTAVERRDAQLARTRRLTVRIAGGAAAASIVLTGALGFALPGHTTSTAGQTTPSGSGTAGSGAGTGSASGGGSAAGSGSAPGTTRRHHSHHRGHLAPPAQQPAPTQAPPVVSSGGS